jgi:hypothetical protein
MPNLEYLKLRFRDIGISSFNGRQDWDNGGVIIDNLTWLYLQMMDLGACEDFRE